MKFQKQLIAYAFLALCITVAGCQKLGKPALGNYPKDPAGAGGTLKLYMAFDGSDVDSIRAMFGTDHNITYVPGISGKAMQGSTNGYIEYPSPSLASNLKSFSVSMWIKTQKHGGGAQSLFMIPQTSGFWANMFMLIEANTGPSDSMLIKFHFGPDGGPNDQWVVYDGVNRLPNMYGDWRHLVFTYDAASSKFNIYVNGQKQNMPAGLTDRKAGNGTPLAEQFNFKDVSKFIIGGYQQDLGSPWNSPDSWMLNYTGLLDQFRIYGKALSDAEVQQLYTSKM